MRQTGAPVVANRGRAVMVRRQELSHPEPADLLCHSAGPSRGVCPGRATKAKGRSRLSRRRRGPACGSEPLPLGHHSAPEAPRYKAASLCALVRKPGGDTRPGSPPSVRALRAGIGLTEGCLRIDPARRRHHGSARAGRPDLPMSGCLDADPVDVLRARLDDLSWNDSRGGARHRSGRQASTPPSPVSRWRHRHPRTA